ncbi:hypothetical protein AX16_009673 [Volvariella volvacea WC 439]|nr:hypothetical protein AX16_009673 [Volvariella volvacea WC 439]
MSRRLDISSLLCDDDPPRGSQETAKHPPQLSTSPPSSSGYHAHPSPGSSIPVVSYSHSPQPHVPSAAVAMHASPSTPSASSPSQPYINFDALVHVATVERRRLGVSNSEEYSPPSVSISPQQRSHQPSRLAIDDSHSHLHHSPPHLHHSPTQQFQLQSSQQQQRPQPLAHAHSLVHSQYQSHQHSQFPSRPSNPLPHHPHRPWELDEHPRQPPVTPHSPHPDHSVQLLSPMYSFSTSRIPETEPIHTSQHIQSSTHYRRHSHSPLQPIPPSSFKAQLASSSEDHYVVGAREQSTSVSPRRPDSSHERRHSGLSEAPIIDRERISVAALSTIASDAPAIYRPTARRTPPGSQAGRAIAARKFGDSEGSVSTHPLHSLLDGGPGHTKFELEMGLQSEHQHIDSWIGISQQPSTTERSNQWPNFQPKTPTEEQVAPPPQSSHYSVVRNGAVHDAMQLAIQPGVQAQSTRVFQGIPSGLSGDSASQMHTLQAYPHPAQSEQPRLDAKAGLAATNAFPRDSHSSSHPPFQAGKTVHSDTRLASHALGPSPGRVAQQPKKTEEDAHSWFLEQIPSSNAGQNTLVSSHPNDPARNLPTPATMPEAATALEKELESFRIPKETENNTYNMPVDVDQMVTNLVEETLGSVKMPDNVMDVDVDNELLSLVEDDARTKGQKPSSSPAPAIERLPMHSDSPQSASVPPSVSGNQLSSARHSAPPEVMPPPAIDHPDRHTSDMTSGKKKKENTTKPVAKAKAKSRTKTLPKSKSKPVDPVATAKPTKPPAALVSQKNVHGASRSRSASVKPLGADTMDVAEEVDERAGSESSVEDDKLYCLCKTKYDEDRFMIACDRCDEWYHTQCVQMPDMEVDLVDQFICPPCIDKNPHLSLKTTYKTRCLNGLKHPDPASPEACHKPARGHFSKYCSEECGVKYMQLRIDAWSKKGGKREKLWESVKNAQKREGVTVCVQESASAQGAMSKGVNLVRAQQRRIDGEVERLNTALERILNLRENLKRSMEVLTLQERLLELASQRAEHIGLCGWDQRLCFGDEEWTDFGSGVLESYEEHRSLAKLDNDMQVDGDIVMEGEGEWWCPGDAVCDRHNGWQGIRSKELAKEREKKEGALARLTTQEREIRKRIEDILDSQECQGQLDASLQPSNRTPRHKAKTHHEPAKKGKKRKAHT